jgi:hypothetical protein
MIKDIFKKKKKKSQSLLTQESNETGLLLEGNDLSPAVNKGMAWANFQFVGKIL